MTSNEINGNSPDDLVTPVTENESPGISSPNYWRISVIFTALSTILWAISLYQLSRTGLAADDLGIVNALPVTYWAAMAILTLASAILWRRPAEHPGLLFLQVGIFLSMLWLTPLIEGLTLFGTRDVFSLHSLTQNILTTSHLNPEMLWYHNWPAVNLLEATMIQIGGIQNAALLLLYAVIPLQLLFVLAIYTLFRNAFGQNNYWAAASWAFLVFDWTSAIIYSPQGIAFCAFLLTLGIYINQISHRDSADEILLIVIMFFGLTVTHLLTSLALLFITIALAIIKKRGFFTLAMIFAAMLAIWLVYYSTTYFTGHFINLLDRILDLRNILFQNLTVSTIGSQGHLTTVTIRMYFSLAAGIIGLVGFLLSRWKRSPLDPVFLTMIIALLVMLPIQFYERELFDRIFIFMLPAVTYFTVRLLSTRITSVVLAIVLLVALPFSIISLHGNQRWNTLPADQIAYMHFLEENTYQGYQPYLQTSLIWLLDQPEASGASEELTNQPAWRSSVEVWQWNGVKPPELISVTPSERVMFQLFADAPNAADETLEWLITNNDYDYVYTTGDVDAFSPR